MSLYGVTRPFRSVLDTPPDETLIGTGWDLVAAEVDRAALVSEIRKAANSLCDERCENQHWYVHDGGRNERYVARLMRAAAKSLS